ncbi:MAG: RNA-guided endonuclease IscB, partial [Dehalococcoidia bacterium]|nr:RNA-guided endonuclease IscB [Dehalococcoidia bacterium]
MKPRRNDPTNTNTVPVLDTESRPLMPTRPSRARRLIRDGRAEKRWLRGVFAIQMRDVSIDDENTIVEGVDLNIDPGASATGLAVTSETPKGRWAHSLVELRHRGNRIRNKLKRRRSLRRNRRSRLRNREPRFNNRTRPEGWMPPSLVSRLQNTTTWVNRLTSLYPVKLIRVETAVFDTQLMQNAEISGEQYQQGDLLGWQLRSYVFHRDGRRCAYCGSDKKKRYELDHIIPRSRGGTDRVSNLHVSCRECNADKANRPVSEFLAD